MKELSIEEKAKRYDEAKYIMEEYLKSGNAGVIAENTIKHAFPELKESEDERIVKELLTFFRESIHGGHILTNKEYDSWIAWLEKQGEQKTADVRTTGYWHVEDVEQKPVWSKDDEGIYQSIIDDTIQEIPLDDKQINWLKSLKERVQPKQEWSDVDKDILFRTIDSLKFLRDTISKDLEYSVNIVDIEREITLLKSLRPQNRWKPSDEQMKALNDINLTGNISYAGQGQELINLYNDLKKLKG